jgi:hypothetical protein
MGLAACRVFRGPQSPVDSLRFILCTSLYRDCFPDFKSALYTLDFVNALRKPRRRDRLDGMGAFADLRQLLLFEGADDRH